MGRNVLYVQSCFPSFMSCLGLMYFISSDNYPVLITSTTVKEVGQFFFPHMAEQKVCVTDPFISKNAMAIACTKLGSFIRSYFHFCSASLSKKLI